MENLINIDQNLSFEDESKIEKLFSADREKWKNKITEFSNMMKDIKKIPDLQVELYSALGFISDYKRNLVNMVIKKTNAVRDKKYSILKTYTEEKSYRYTAAEKNIIIEGNLKNSMKAMEILNSQVEFYEEIYSILNNMVYGIKYRIEVESYRSEM